MRNSIARRDFTRTAGLVGLSFLGAGLQRAAGKAVKRIGIEEHWNMPAAGNAPPSSSAQPTGYWMAGARLPTPVGKLRSINDLDDLRLSEMDKAGITMQVVGGSGIQAIRDTARAIDVAKRSNDMAAGLIEKHRDRFAGFAAIPTQDPKAAADEFERAVRQLGFKGAMVGGRANGRFLDEDAYQVLWERIAALEAPIYIHPADPTPEILKMYEGRPALSANTWTWGVETATHALRIITSGIFDVYPKAQVILGHLGESLPYLLGRFDEGVSTVKPESKGMKKTLSAYIKENIFITTSGWYQPEALACAIKALGADRVLFATDYPWVDTALAVKMFEQTPMSAADREKIYHRNAERWLKLS